MNRQQFLGAKSGGKGTKGKSTGKGKGKHGKAASKNKGKGKNRGGRKLNVEISGDSKRGPIGRPGGLRLRGRGGSFAS